MNLLQMILPIISTIALLSFQGYASEARDSKRMADIQNINSKIQVEWADTGKIPEQISLDVNLQDPLAGQVKSDGCVYGYEYKVLKNAQSKSCGYSLSACIENGEKYSRVNDSDCNK